jgi:hypothetical protein
LWAWVLEEVDFAVVISGGQQRVLVVAVTVVDVRTIRSLRPDSYTNTFVPLVYFTINMFIDHVFEVKVLNI